MSTESFSGQRMHVTVVLRGRISARWKSGCQRPAGGGAVHLGQEVFPRRPGAGRSVCGRRRRGCFPRIARRAREGRTTRSWRVNLPCFDASGVEQAGDEVAHPRGGRDDDGVAAGADLRVVRFMVIVPHCRESREGIFQVVGGRCRGTRFFRCSNCRAVHWGRPGRARAFCIFSGRGAGRLSKIKPRMNRNKIRPSSRPAETTGAHLAS